MLDREQILDRRVLEEIVYHRVRLAIDLEDLDAFAEDLSRSFARVLGLENAEHSSSHLAVELIETVWGRVTSDVLEELVDGEVGRGEDAVAGGATESL